MSTFHSHVVSKAGAALDAVFSDKSVGRDTTKESLEELRDQIDGMLDALKADAGRTGEEEVE